MRTTIALAWLAAAGCGGERAAVRETAEQQAAMVQEHATWTMHARGWRDAGERMKAWHAAHPVSSKEEDALERLRRHDEKLSRHETDAEEFRRDLAALEAKLNGISKQGERSRLAAHGELWAEHMRLKLAYEGLEGGHRELAGEHAAFIADSATVPR